MNSIKSIKSFFAICLFWLASSNACLAASSNILDELMYEANLQTYYKNYAGALRANDLALNIAEANRSTYFTYFARLYENRFHTLQNMKRYDEAYATALKTKEILSTDPAKDGANYSNLLREIAEMLMEEGKYAAAEKFAFEAVENLESKGTDDELIMPDLYRVLSRAYVKLGKLEQAVSVLKKAVAFSNQQGKTSSLQKSASLEDLSKVYRTLGRTDLAELADKENSKIEHTITMVSNVRVERPKNYSPVAFDRNSCTQPKYPEEALQQQLRGTAKFRFLIDENGGIAAKYISVSSGSVLLDTATLQAFSRCKFSPEMHDGKAMRSWFSGQFVWNLPN
ncbi:TonB family protein [Undibacterium sp. TC4M20W]|uniref:TonB family protein n=1 Tax=Undibacterium sp. TC4M20W TaxID=3413052 RepID=UPI003BF3DA15